MAAAGSEQPLPHRLRQQPGSTELENQFVSSHRHDVGATQVSTHEQVELAHQCFGARLSEVAPDGSHAVRAQGADDSTMFRHRRSGEGGKLVKGKLTGEVVGGGELTDHAAAGRRERRQRRLTTLDELAPVPQAGGRKSVHGAGEN